MLHIYLTNVNKLKIKLEILQKITYLSIKGVTESMTLNRVEWRKNTSAN